MGERLNGIQEVRGSNPLSSTGVCERKAIDHRRAEAKFKGHHSPAGAMDRRVAPAAAVIPMAT